MRLNDALENEKIVKKANHGIKYICTRMESSFTPTNGQRGL